MWILTEPLITAADPEGVVSKNYAHRHAERNVIFDKRSMNQMLLFWLRVFCRFFARKLTLTQGVKPVERNGYTACL